MANNYDRDRFDANLSFWEDEELGSGAADSSALKASAFEGLTLVVRCSAVSGTSPTLDIDIYASEDNSTFVLYDADSVKQITAADDDRRVKLYSDKYRYWKLSPTIGGSATPKVTVDAFLSA